MIKSRRIKYAGHTTRRRAMHTGVWCKNQKGRDHLEDINIAGRIILKWSDGVMWTGLMCSRTIGALANMVMNLLVPYTVEIFLGS
jgi:hypothetical protein